MSYGAAFTAWRDASPDWDAFTRHEFVEGLKTGALPRSAFLHYLVQDYIFLVHFARAWALGVVKAETLDEMKTCAATVDGLVNHEMQLHVGICAEAGIYESELSAATEETGNMAYTRYVLDAGFSGDFLDLMAALAPCVTGYGVIGTRLKVEAGETQYRDWIETYADEEYQNVCRNVGAMIDSALERRIGPDPKSSPRWAALQKRFDDATRLEVGFWDMGLSGG
ncbi:MAG: thiaminase II [Pseudomonadota bacterium]